MLVLYAHKIGLRIKNKPKCYLIVIVLFLPITFFIKQKINSRIKRFFGNGNHYKKKLAKLMFARIFNDQSIIVQKDFGVCLTSDNIDQFLQNTKEKAYLNSL